MKLRIPIIVLALVLPVVAAIIVARVALPTMIAVDTKKAITDTLGISSVNLIVPETLEEAKALTTKRLLHLQKLSQAQWDAERKTIPHKNPPETIEAAIARTQLRLGDLNAMKAEDWKAEKEKLELRQQRLQTRADSKKTD